MGHGYRSYSVMVWRDYLLKKSLVGGGWQTKFNVSPGLGLWSLVLGPYGPDLGPDLDLTWDLDLDLSLTITPKETEADTKITRKYEPASMDLPTVHCWSCFMALI